MTGKAYGECLTMIRAIHSAVSPVVTKEYAGPCRSHCCWRRDGAEACLGCGHEHNCSTHGCTIIREAAERVLQLQKAFALACRVLGDDSSCPAFYNREKHFPACVDCPGNLPGNWACWQNYIMQRFCTEQVCRICGCTQYNA